MQQFAVVDDKAAYLPLQGFTSADLGYERGNAVSNMVHQDRRGADDARSTSQLFDQIWNNPEQLEDVTDAVHEHIASVYAENSPARIYFLILYNLFAEFLDDINEDVLPERPHRLPGHRSLEEPLQLPAGRRHRHHQQARDLQRLHPRRQRRPREDVHGAGRHQVLRAAQQVGARARARRSSPTTGRTTTPTSRPTSSPATGSTTTCSPTPTSRARAASRWASGSTGSTGATTTSSSSTSRTTSATPTTPRRRRPATSGSCARSSAGRQDQGADALGDAGEQPLHRPEEPARARLRGRVGEPRRSKLDISTTVEEVFSEAQRAFNEWSKLPAEERTTDAILQMLDFDFFELLDAVTIARSRKHIQAFYDTTEIGAFPERLPARSRSAQPLTDLPDVPSFNEIFEQLQVLTLAVYTPAGLRLPEQARASTRSSTTSQGGTARGRTSARPAASRA